VVELGDSTRWTVLLLWVVMMMMRSGSRRWTGWTWTMAWPRPFDSADITYASAPSHQTTRTTSLDCLFGRGWYAKAEHRARELHQAMTL
jgi:hypothetical protein